MARQDGVIKGRGQMGGISFYKTQDGHLMRLKGGVSGDRIKNDPAFVRTRENGAEFGRAGTSSKTLRIALRTLVQNAGDNRMVSRLTQAMVKVIQSDTINPRGERKVNDGDIGLLGGFDFNQNAKLSSTLFAPFTASVDRVSGSLSVDIPDFIASQQIAAPQGATHFRLVTGACEVDFETGDYGVSTAQSVELPLSPELQQGMTLSQSVTPASTKPLFLVFGIVFFQNVNGAFYPLRNGAFNALTIVAVDKP